MERCQKEHFHSPVLPPLEMLAEPPDGAHGADAHHRHLVGLEAAHGGLDEGRRGRVRELVGELAPDPETAAEEERGRWKERLICGILDIKWGARSAHFKLV